MIISEKPENVLLKDTTGHAPKIKWEINVDDALDLLIIASYTHRRLEKFQCLFK